MHQSKQPRPSGRGCFGCAQGSPWAQGVDSPYQGEMARRAKRGRDAGPKGLRGFEHNKFSSTLISATDPLRHFLRKCHLPLPRGARQGEAFASLKAFRQTRIRPYKLLDLYILHTITRIIIDKNHRIILTNRFLIMQMPYIDLSIVFKSSHLTFQTNNRNIDSLRTFYSFY